jgi:Tfp pilus assembly protein PilF
VNLSITLSSRDIIFQCADFRLTDRRTKLPWDFVSQKVIVLNRFGWSALASFVGTGHTGQLDVAEWLASRTALIPQDAPFDELSGALLDANDWLQALPRRSPHTFTVAAFAGASPRAVLVSNFESLHARPSSTPRERLEVSERTFLKPTLLITGQPTAVREEDRQWLLQLLRERRPPREIHEALARVNARAARTNGSISQGCFTAHLHITGEGEALPHGLDEARKYQPDFLRQIMPGLSLNQALDEQGRPKPIRMVGMTFGRMDQTDEFHRELLRAKPNDASTYNNYGAYLADAKKDIDGAMKAYRRALELDPDHSLALGNYAVLVWRHQGDLDEAERLLRRAVAADPNQSVNHPKYAEILWTVRGNFADADKVYREGLAINSQDATLLLSFAGFKAMRRDFAESARSYEAYLAVGQRNADTLSNYAAVLYLSGGDADHCIALYREALAKQPDLPSALVNLAQLLFCRRKGGDHLDREANA